MRPPEYPLGDGHTDSNSGQPTGEHTTGVGAAYEETDSGLLLPRPTGKRCVVLAFDMNPGQQVEADSINDVVERVASAKSRSEQYVIFSDPLFGDEVWISVSAFDKVMFLGYKWIDMEEMKQGIALAEASRGAMNREQRRAAAKASGLHIPGSQR